MFSFSSGKTGVMLIAKLSLGQTQNDLAEARLVKHSSKVRKIYSNWAVAGRLNTFHLGNKTTHFDLFYVSETMIKK